MKLSFIAGLVVISSISFNAYALNIDMKPGLWAHSFKMSNGSGGITTNKQHQYMEGLPPEQRKIMEDVLAKNVIDISDGGIELTGNALDMIGNGTTVKACMTQADIDRGAMPQTDKNCEQKITQVSSTQFKTTYICKGAHPTQGEGEITLQSNKAYTGKMKMTTQVNGKPATIQGEQSGKWLSSDCGNIKPAAQIQR